MYIMEIPNKKGGDGRTLWRNEVKRFAKKLEALTGKKITLEKLNEASKIVNERRKALQRLSFLRSFDIPPISGLDALLINQVSFYDDPVRFTAKVSELCDELDERVKQGIGVSEALFVWLEVLMPATVPLAIETGDIAPFGEGFGYRHFLKGKDVAGVGFKVLAIAHRPFHWFGDLVESASVSQDGVRRRPSQRELERSNRLQCLQKKHRLLYPLAESTFPLQIDPSHTEL